MFSLITGLESLISTLLNNILISMLEVGFSVDVLSNILKSLSIVSKNIFFNVKDGRVVFKKLDGAKMVYVDFSLSSPKISGDGLVSFNAPTLLKILNKCKKSSRVFLTHDNDGCKLYIQDPRFEKKIELPSLEEYDGEEMKLELREYDLKLPETFNGEALINSESFLEALRDCKIIHGYRPVHLRIDSEGFHVIRKGDEEGDVHVRFKADWIDGEVEGGYDVKTLTSIVESASSLNKFVRISIDGIGVMKLNFSGEILDSIDKTKYSMGLIYFIAPVFD